MRKAHGRGPWACNIVARNSARRHLPGGGGSWSSGSMERILLGIGGPVGLTTGESDGIAGALRSKVGVLSRPAAESAAGNSFSIGCARALGGGSRSTGGVVAVARPMFTTGVIPRLALGSLVAIGCTPLFAGGGGARYGMPPVAPTAPAVAPLVMPTRAAGSVGTPLVRVIAPPLFMGPAGWPPFV